MLGAQPEDWNRIAVAAEELGYHGVAISDHVVYPSYLASKYPYTPDGTPQFSPEENWPDVWVAIGSMAAVTTRLHFMTNVYVLPLRNPFVAAKAIGTAAYLSGNRVGVGVGAGWMREEFDLMEQRFDQRGARMDEMLEVMAGLWAGGMFEHHGRFYDFDPVDMRPAPTAPVPVYIGGASDVAFRRAARHDGWLGLYHAPEELIEHCRTLRRFREDAGTADRPFEIIAAPLAKPSRDLLDDLETEGVTTILTSAWLPKGVLTPTGDEAVALLTSYAERFLHI
jgi:probable F420-dependent oxidoreductase